MSKSLPSLVVGACIFSFVFLSASGVPAQSSMFRPAEEDTFVFDTGQLRGQLRTNKMSFGIHNLQHAVTGKALAGRYGLMNVYRVFSDGKRYGVAGWGWPSHVKQLDDGAVAIECPGEEQRPFTFRGIYRWAGPGILDLQIEVLPQRDLHDFEVFLASYFDPAFSSCQINVRSMPNAPNTAGFMAARKSLGNWLMFPRDKASVRLIQDGRWQLPPHPVDWKILPELERPLVVRRDVEGDLTALLMARTRDCFAVSMPYETEGHFSVYLSLFGRELPAGRTAIARTRLQVLATPNEAKVLECFEAFQKVVRDNS